MSDMTRFKAKVAALSRSRPADDPEFIEARRSLAAANVERAITKLTASAPPLKPEQVQHLEGVLRASARRESQE